MSITYQQKAKEALDHLYARYWTDSDGGHILPTHCGAVVEKPQMIWEMAMMMMAMETYYDATRDEDTKKRIVGTWNYLNTCFTREQIVGCFGFEPNLALDDTGWTAMVCLMAYRFTGDPEALTMAKECLLGAYDHWKDGELCNGLWYNDWAQYNTRWKSSYIVSLLVSAIEHCRITKGTDAYSQELLDQTMTLYEWVERDLRRDRCITFENGLMDGGSYTVDVIDHLYWIDYNCGAAGGRRPTAEFIGPCGGTQQNQIKEFDSVTALFANMGMAYLNMKLYEMFGDDKYLEKAMQTNRSIIQIYNNNGTYLNDRDPNTEATMLSRYIQTILGTRYGTAEERDMLFRTADNIYTTGHNTNGMYYPWWGKVFQPGEIIPETNKQYVDADSIMINATSVTMICGAAMLENLGFSPSYTD